MTDNNNTARGEDGLAQEREKLLASRKQQTGVNLDTLNDTRRTSSNNSYDVHNFN